MKNVEKEFRTNLMIASMNAMNNAMHNRLSTYIWNRTAEAVEAVTVVKNEVHFKLTHPKLK